MGVEVLPLDLGLQLVLFVRQQVDFNKGVGGAREVLGWEVLAPENFDREGRVLETVAYAELDPTQLFTDGPFIILRTWGQLQGNKSRQIIIMLRYSAAAAAAAATHMKLSIQGHRSGVTHTQTLTERSCEGRRF